MKILTTNEMDGLLTPEDIAIKDIVYIQCRDCTKWTEFDINFAHKQCSHCGSNQLDAQSTTSKRTFNPIKAKGRKVR